MTTPVLKAPCGKTRNARNKRFTEQSLRDHVASCSVCQGKEDRILEEAGIDPEIYAMVDDDLPDGAFWAMYHEMGGSW